MCHNAYNCYCPHGHVERPELRSSFIGDLSTLPGYEANQSLFAADNQIPVSTHNVLPNIPEETRWEIISPRMRKRVASDSPDLTSRRTSKSSTWDADDVNAWAATRAHRPGHTPRSIKGSACYEHGLASTDLLDSDVEDSRHSSRTRDSGHERSLPEEQVERARSEEITRMAMMTARLRIWRFEVGNATGVMKDSSQEEREGTSAKRRRLGRESREDEECGEVMFMASRNAVVRPAQAVTESEDEEAESVLNRDCSNDSESKEEWFDWSEGDEGQGDEGKEEEKGEEEEAENEKRATESGTVVEVQTCYRAQGCSIFDIMVTRSGF